MKKSVLSLSVALLVCFAAMQEAHAINRNADFDGDGIDDLAIGVPQEDGGATNAVGVVNILYGSASSLNDPATRSTTLWQDLVVGGNAAEGVAEASDRFGEAIAWGDFNGDCFDDLAVGVPGEDSSAGIVQVFYSSATGLSTASDEIWDRAVTNIDDAPAAGDQFGASLASGDFNADGFDDIAIGVTGDDIVSGAGGSVHIIYGGSAGLSATTGPGDQIFSRATTGIGGDPEEGGVFGKTLATGDFDCDGIDDLAIGDYLGNGGMGDVTIIYGTGSGLSASGGPFGSQRWDQDSTDVIGVAEFDDFFGFSLAVGNFNGDSEDGFVCHDLAIGSPGEAVGTEIGAGSINVLYGSVAAGLTSVGNQLWNQDSTNIEDTAEASDDFGWSLVAGRLDNDGFDDLAIGVPGENSDAGAVAILRGSTTNGLVSTSDVLWTQDTTNVPDTAEASDRFGSAVSFGREWNTSADRALAVGVSGENSTEGLVNVIYLQNTATPTPAVLGNQIWDQGSIDTQVTESGDRFGTTFTAPRDKPFGVCD